MCLPTSQTDALVWTMVIGGRVSQVARVTPRRAGTATRPYKLGMSCLSGLVIWLVVGNGAAAQATPTPDVPPAVLCTVEAPSFKRLNEIVQAPMPDASPVATRTPGVVPEGEPADTETTAAVTAVVRELVGCYNAGELLRAYGLYTDQYLRRLFNRQGGFSHDIYDSLATPEPAADTSKHTAILEIKDVRKLDDGTVGATVTMRYTSIPMPKTFFFTFVWTGERWLIAGILGEISFSVP